MLWYDGLTVKKKDGYVEKFDPNKIIRAITLSSQRALVNMSSEDFDSMLEIIRDKIEYLQLEQISIEQMHHFVECALDTYNPAVAKSYREYRNYKIDFVEMMDKVYQESQTIRYVGDKENANTDSALVATKRSLIFNELNRRLYQKFFMTIEERQACKDGYIYIHDQSARLDTINCCLFNAEGVLKDGFEMGNIFYNEPKTLDVAFDVLSDVILSTASQQYGGFTVPEVDKLMSYYAAKSLKIAIKKYIDRFTEAELDMCISTNNKEQLIELVSQWAYNDVKREFEQGWQGIEMKLNTVGSSRGDYPFITMTFGLATDPLGKMASETFLNVHKNGQGKPGYKKPVLFPKLVFLYDEELHGDGGVNHDLWELAVEVSSKTMYPDHLSLTGKGYVPEMYKKYKRVVSPMGCVDKNEVVTYRLDRKLYVESISRMWNRLSNYYTTSIQANGQLDMYMDVDPKRVQIYDMEYEYVGVRRMVKNNSNNWARVTFSNGRELMCTTDHPLPVLGKGRTFVSDLKIGDIVPINNIQPVGNGLSASDVHDVDLSWMIGILIKDLVYYGYHGTIVNLDVAVRTEEVANKISRIAHNMNAYTTYEGEFDSEDVVICHIGYRDDGSGYKMNRLLELILDSKTIHVPNEIFRSGVRSRIAFLIGIMESSAIHMDDSTHHSIRLGNFYKETALQIAALARSLYMKAEVKLVGSSSNPFDDLYEVNISCAKDTDLPTAVIDKIFAGNDVLEYFNRHMIQMKDENADKFDEIDSYAEVIDIQLYSTEYVNWSYDVTTESDHFDVSGIYSHNCRAFLSPWFERGGMKPADDDDKPIFVGRFNIGAVSLHLPMILAKARAENKDFYEVLDYYMEMIRGLHQRTYQYLGNLRASVNPVMFCEGGALGGHLQPGDKIAPLLKPMTASFGITALNELQELYNGKSLVEDGEFTLEVMRYINNKITEFKEADGILYAIYGTPAENLCHLQIKQFRKLYGEIPKVSDREYISNSFHCHVSEDITPIQKQDLEERFWDMFNGGKIQYVKYPIDYNKPAIRTLLKRAMDKGFYEGVNLDLGYCNNCGHEELGMDVCPKCGSRDLVLINRMNGYLAYSRVHGESRLNDGKMAEIRDRVSM